MSIRYSAILSHGSTAKRYSSNICAQSGGRPAWNCVRSSIGSLSAERHEVKFVRVTLSLGGHDLVQIARSESPCEGVRLAFMAALSKTPKPQSPSDGHGSSAKTPPTLPKLTSACPHVNAARSCYWKGIRMRGEQIVALLTIECYARVSACLFVGAGRSG